MKQNKHLIVLIGPTASGKTSVAIHLASQLGTEIASCDSRQFYKEMSIGTAMPSAEELAQVPHHFIAYRSVEDFLSAGQFAREFESFTNNWFQTEDYLVLTGGSMLYEKAATDGLDEFPQVPENVRNTLIEIQRTLGISALQEELLSKDPEYFAEVDTDNPQRLIRALEIIRHTGEKYSQLRKNTTQEKPYNIIRIGIETSREELYERINTRVDQMMQQGLVEEAKALLPYKNLPALQTVGYKELFQYLDGTINLETAISEIKKNSRRYAKRQLTWYRKDERIKWFSRDDTANMLAYILANSQ
ncbi:MAG: tRNA (adenosine(37)-N6)-dimethylallyltransferase MiaA [Weeksellaceae bacterium]|nr:tRNA (adenosine(37)-N6)-dimethylallyltransferase MiaA [Weeksellaceae bacterium]